MAHRECKRQPKRACKIALAAQNLFKAPSSTQDTAGCEYGSEFFSFGSFHLQGVGIYKCGVDIIADCTLMTLMDRSSSSESITPSFPRRQKRKVGHTNRGSISGGRRSCKLTVTKHHPSGASLGAPHSPSRRTNTKS